MQAFLKGDHNPMNELMGKKIEQINKLKANSNCYAETNHCFIKGFGWLIPNYIPSNEIGIIILRRAKEEVLQSFMHLGHSPLIPHGRVWYMTPQVRNYIKEPPSLFGSVKGYYHLMRLINFLFFYRGYNKKLVYEPKWIKEYAYQLMSWYVDETYNLAELYRRTFPEITFYDIELKHLNEYKEVIRMLNTFGLYLDESMKKYIGKKTNSTL